MSALMRVLFSALAAAVAIASTGCGDGCRSLETADVTGGKVVYATGDGTRIETSRVDLWGSTRSAIELRGQLGSRPFRITIDHLASGETRTLAHDDSAALCLPVADRASPTCLLLEGTVETHTLRVDDCEGNENITLCGRTVDLVVHATSHDLGLDVAIDATVLMKTGWKESACGPD